LEVGVGLKTFMKAARRIIVFLFFLFFFFDTNERITMPHEQIFFLERPASRKHQ
jgi:hypothetical protein